MGESYIQVYRAIDKKARIISQYWRKNPKVDGSKYHFARLDDVTNNYFPANIID